jgi:hypothetical protein
MTVSLNLDVMRKLSGLNGLRLNMFTRVEITRNIVFSLLMEDIRKKKIFRLEQYEKTIVGEKNLMVYIT